MITHDLRVKSNNPNSEEINKLLIEKLRKNNEILSLKTKLIMAQASLDEINQTIEYLGGKCSTCGELGNLVFTTDEDGDKWCQFCK